MWIVKKEKAPTATTGAMLKCRCGNEMIFSLDNTCSACGNSLLFDGALCPTCSGEISYYNEICPNCGMELDHGVLCPECGGWMERGSGQCPHCDTNIIGRYTFCPKCHQLTPIESIKAGHCTRCNSKIDMGKWNFRQCEMCGNLFIDQAGKGICTYCGWHNDHKKKVTKEVLKEKERLESLLEKTDEPNPGLVGKVLDYEHEYDWRDRVVKVGDMAELRDVAGNIAVPAIYDDFVIFPPTIYDNYPKMEIHVAIAKKQGLLGLVKRDGTGTPITEFIYETMEVIYETCGHILFLARRAGSTKMTVIDSYGTTIIPEIIDAFASLTPWLRYYRYKSNGKYGVQAEEPSGTNVIPPIYDDIYAKEIGNYFVFVYNGQEGYVTAEEEGGHFFIPIEEYKEDKYVFFDGEGPFIYKKQTEKK